MNSNLFGLIKAASAYETNNPLYNFSMDQAKALDQYGRAATSPELNAAPELAKSRFADLLAEIKGVADKTQNNTSPITQAARAALLPSVKIKKGPMSGYTHYFSTDSSPTATALLRRLATKDMPGSSLGILAAPAAIGAAAAAPIIGAAVGGLGSNGSGAVRGAARGAGAAGGGLLGGLLGMSAANALDASLADKLSPGLRTLLTAGTVGAGTLGGGLLGYRGARALTKTDREKKEKS